MNDLIKALREKVEYEKFKYRADVSTPALLQYQKGAASENARLAPLISKLIAVIETVENEESPDKAMDELRKAVGDSK